MIQFIEESHEYNVLKNIINSTKFNKIIIICDINTLKLALPYFLEVSTLNSLNIQVVSVPAGEKNKTLLTCSKVWKKLLDLNLDKDSIIINIGGGIVSDLGGFVASIYKRGIKFINIPTTLLAMIDASVGGKTGVNFNGLKNQLGVINDPILTVIDLFFLKTLPKRQLKNGYAEMLKHGLIADKNYWDLLINNNYKNIDINLVKRSLEIKMQIVDIDRSENGLRKILNFGHTIGHALESLIFKKNGKKHILHGEAVAAGMIIESFISYELNFLSNEEYQQIKNGLGNIFKYIDINVDDFGLILESISNDKKNRDSQMLFSLLKYIGDAIYNVPVSVQQIISALENYTYLQSSKLEKVGLE